MAIKGSMDKLKVAHTYIQMLLFSHKEEWSTDDMCYNMNEPWKYYAKWKNLDTKSHILYASICMTYTYPEQLNSYRKQIGGFQGLVGGEGRTGTCCLMGTGFLGGWWKCFWNR